MKLSRLMLVFILLPGIVAFIPTIHKAATNVAQSDFTTYYWASKWSFTLPFKHPYSNLAPLYPFFYPPAALILLRPFSLLPYQTAVAVWTWLSFAAFVIGFRLACDSLKTVGLAIPLWLQSILFFSFVFFKPVRFTFNAGQANAFIFFFISAAFYFYLREQDFLSGVFLALATILKITPILLLIFFLLRGRTKIFFFGLAVICVFSGLAEYFVQWDQSINWYYLRRVVHHVSDQGNAVYRDQSILSLVMIWRGFWDQLYSNYLEQYLGEILSGRRFYAVVSYIITGFAVLYSLVSVPLSARWRRDDASVATDYASLLLVGVIGSGLAWFHQYTILIFSFLVGLGLVFKMRWGLLKFLSLILLVGIGFCWAYNWEPYTYNRGFSPWYLSSVMLFGAIVLYFILLIPRWGFDAAFDKSTRLRLKS